MQGPGCQGIWGTCGPTLWHHISSSQPFDPSPQLHIEQYWRGFLILLLTYIQTHTHTETHTHTHITNREIQRWPNHPSVYSGGLLWMIQINSETDVPLACLPLDRSKEYWKLKPHALNKRKTLIQFLLSNAVSCRQHTVIGWVSCVKPRSAVYV